MSTPGQPPQQTKSAHAAGAVAGDQSVSAGSVDTNASPIVDHAVRNIGGGQAVQPQNPFEPYVQRAAANTTPVMLAPPSVTAAGAPSVPSAAAAASQQQQPLSISPTRSSNSQQQPRGSASSSPNQGRPVMTGLPDVTTAMPVAPSMQTFTSPPPPHQQHQPPVQTQFQTPPPNFDDDETTEPSSAAHSSDHQHMFPPGGGVGGGGGRRRATSRVAGSDPRVFLDHDALEDDDDDDDDYLDGALICGYLQKLGRNGKWQTRWFETDGECLSYYKSKKRSKLLATLDLEKVGTIEIDVGDSHGLSFRIEVLGRDYHLRADSRAACKDWVITLNRVKEARLQQGNVKLVDPYAQTPVVDENGDVVAPRVVVVANRQRTRAMAESQDFDNMLMRPDDNGENNASTRNSKRVSTIGTVVLARWSKRRSSLDRLGAKLVKWARSLRRYTMSCQDSEAPEDRVVLDRYVHPPGHDHRQGQHQRPSLGRAFSSKGRQWEGHQHSNPASLSNAPGGGTSAAAVASGGDSTSTPDKPPMQLRSQSTASEDIRMIS